MSGTYPTNPISPPSSTPFSCSNASSPGTSPRMPVEKLKLYELVSSLLDPSDPSKGFKDLADRKIYQIVSILNRLSSAARDSQDPILAENQSVLESTLLERISLLKAQILQRRQFASPPSSPLPESMPFAQKCKHAARLPVGYWSLLEYACADENIENIRDLASIGCEVNALDSQGFTPLHNSKSTDVTDTLLKSGANPHLLSKDKKSPLHKAFNADIAQLLIKRGLSVHAEDDNKMTPLHYARTPEIVFLLLDQGALIDAKDRFGRTPIELLGEPCKQALISRGASLPPSDQ